MSQLTDFTKPLSAFPKIKGVTLESDPLDGADVEQPAPIDQPTETQHKLDSYIAANRESTRQRLSPIGVSRARPSQNSTRRTWTRFAVAC